MQWFLSLPFFLQMVVLYLALINIVAFFFYGLDKLKSQVQRRRISEMKLWLLALIGGSLGALAGMHFFRHKTKKVSFQLGIALILLAQIAAIVLFVAV